MIFPMKYLYREVRETFNHTIPQNPVDKKNSRRMETKLDVTCFQKRETRMIPRMIYQEPY